MHSRVWREKPLTGQDAIRWLKAKAAANDVFMAAGFKPIVGVPLGQLFDAPGIVAEASAFASSVQSKESKKQGRPVEVEYDFVMAGDHLHVRVSY